MLLAGPYREAISLAVNGLPRRGSNGPIAEASIPKEVIIDTTILLYCCSLTNGGLVFDTARLPFTSDFRAELSQGVFSRVSLKLAFPNDNHSPSQESKLRRVLGIPLCIAAQFLSPVFNVRGWPDKVLAPLMHMPETPVNEYNSPMLGKNNVWTTWKTSHVFVIAKSRVKEKLAHKLLWFGVRTANMGHIAASNRSGMVVHMHSPTGQPPSASRSSITFSASAQASKGGTAFPTC